MITVSQVHKILDKHFRRFKLKVYRPSNLDGRINLFGGGYFEFGLDDCISKKEAEKQIANNLIFALEELIGKYRNTIEEAIKIKKQIEKPQKITTGFYERK